MKKLEKIDHNFLKQKLIRLGYQNLKFGRRGDIKDVFTATACTQNVVIWNIMWH
jgi:hypothetical protein